MSKKFYIQGGDVDGSGGRCVLPFSDEELQEFNRVGKFGGDRFFDDESYCIDHSEVGLVSMASHGVHQNGSQFFITLSEVRVECTSLIL